jgi:hypothetical protein
MYYRELTSAAMSAGQCDQSGEPIAEAVRHYNRRRFILARRSLPRVIRPRFDKLALELLYRSMAAWSGSLVVSYSDLADLVAGGWVKR